MDYYCARTLRLRFYKNRNASHRPAQKNDNLKKWECNYVAYKPEQQKPSVKQLSWAREKWKSPRIDRFISIGAAVWWSYSIPTHMTDNSLYTTVEFHFRPISCIGYGFYIGFLCVFLFDRIGIFLGTNFCFHVLNEKSACFIRPNRLNLKTFELFRLLFVVSVFIGHGVRFHLNLGRNIAHLCFLSLLLWANNWLPSDCFFHSSVLWWCKQFPCMLFVACLCYRLWIKRKKSVRH